MENRGSYLCGFQGSNQLHSTVGKSLTYLRTRRGAEECLQQLHQMHSMPCNNEAKCFPFPMTALPSLELPEKHMSNHAPGSLQQVQGNPIAVFETHHMLPSSWVAPAYPEGALGLCDTWGSTHTGVRW